MRACFGKNNGYLLKCHEFDPMKAHKKNKKRHIDGCPVVEKCYQAYLKKSEKEDTEMKIIKIEKRGSYTHHGIGHTEHDGYGGTSDNRMSIKLATAIELKSMEHGERYQLVVNGKNKGTFVK